MTNSSSELRAGCHHAHDYAIRVDPIKPDDEASPGRRFRATIDGVTKRAEGSSSPAWTVVEGWPEGWFFADTALEALDTAEAALKEWVDLQERSLKIHDVRNTSRSADKQHRQQG